MTQVTSFSVIMDAIKSGKRVEVLAPRKRSRYSVRTVPTRFGTEYEVRNNKCWFVNSVRGAYEEGWKFFVEA